MTPFFLNKKSFYILFLFSFPFLLYFNSYQAEFHFDDKAYILDSPEIKNVSGCLHALGQSFFQPGRTLVTLTFALNYAVHGFELPGYHIVNILFHALNCCLIFLILKKLLGSSNAGNVNFGAVGSETAAFAAALIFLVHPLAVNSVTYVTQRHVLLATFFYLAGFLFYIVAVEKKGKVQLLLFVLCGACYWSAIHSKPMSLTLPFILLGYECILHSRQNAHFIGRRKLMLFLAVCFSLFLGLYAFKIGLFENGTSLAGFNAENLWGIQTHILTELKVFLHYLKLIFLPLPVWLCTDHNYPLARAVDFFVFGSLLGHISIVMIGAWAFLKGLRFISFGIFWFYVTLTLPYLFLPILDVMVEYKTYLPSVGMFCVVAEGFRHIAEKKGPKALGFLLLPILILASWTTYQRNEVFLTEMSFWSDVIEKYPDSSRPYNNRGLNWHAQGKYNEAINDYKKALTLDSKNIIVHANIGNSYRALNDFDQAVYHCTEYIKLAPDNADGYVRLGNVYALQNKWQKAVKVYSRATELNPNDIGALYNLGLGLSHIGERSRSFQIFKKIVQRDPSHYMGLTSLGVCYYTAGNRNLAAKYFKRAIHVKPEYGEAIYNLAAWHAGRGELGEARSLAERLERIDPQRGYNLLKLLEGQ